MVDIVLARPIQAHGRTVEQLQLREPRPEDVWDLRLSVSDSGVVLVFGDLITFAGRLAEIPPSSVKALAPEDCGQLMQAALPLLVPFLGGGNSPSAS